jgi:LPXTG-motif cell wall-anchored protein
MKLKRLLVLAGVMALIGMLWSATAGADSHHPTITLDPTTVPAEVGDVTITVTGADWTEPSPFFIVACPGAAGDPTAPLTLSSAPEAIAMCPNLMAAALPVQWDDGGFTTEWTVGITQADIDVGALVVMAGWLSTDTLADPESFATVGLLHIGEAEEPMDDPGEEEPMDDPGEEEPMDDPGEEELPVTGSDSSLLVIVGAGILAAGLLAIGAGRRVRTATR